MIICPKCKTENKETAEKCSSCGEFLKHEDIGRTEIIRRDEKSSSSEHDLNTVDGRYEILEELGKGSFAVVYKARDIQLDRFIALKTLKLSGLTDEDRKRFVREARTSAKLNHPNIVTVYDTGQDGEISFIAMEILAGKDLKSVLREKGPFHPSSVLKIAIQICRALESAHSKGIVHRDIKPANIVIDDNDRVKVTDFGLAKIFDEEESSSQQVAITKAGTILGTLAYMSPEQIKGEKLNGRTDIYSFGAVLYELVSGKPPFVAEKPLELLKMHTDIAPVPLQDVCSNELPSGLSDLVMKCLNKDRADRYRDAGEIADELQKIASAIDIDTSIKTKSLDASERKSPHPVEELGKDPFVGKIVRDCEILEILGEGGMASVYKAKHTELGTYRAIKVIRPELASQSGFYERFKNEAILAENLTHPNLVTLYDFTRLEDGSLFAVWEYVEGETLEQIIKKKGAFPPAEAVRIVKKICDGLDAAHLKGIVHRDISPDNIMLVEDRNTAEKHVKVIDFGIAKDMSPSRPSESHLTEIGVFVGKIGYSSPEQLGDLKKGETIDHRTDIFSIGIVLYKMLLAEIPFNASAVTSYMRDIATSTPENLEKKIGNRIPEELRKVIIKCLMTDREDRYQNIKELKSALNRALMFLTGHIKPSKRKRTPTRKSLSVLLLLVVLASLLYAFRNDLRLKFFPAPQIPPPVNVTTGEMKQKLTELINKAELAINEDRLDIPKGNNAVYFASEIVDLTGIPELGTKITSRVSESFTRMGNAAIESPELLEEDIDRALEFFQKAVSHNKNNDAAKGGLHYAKALKHLADNKPESAIDELEKSLKEDPERTGIKQMLADTHQYLSDYYTGLNRLADADSHMKKAMFFNSNLKKTDFKLHEAKGASQPPAKEPVKIIEKKDPVKIPEPVPEKTELPVKVEAPVKKHEDYISYNNSAKAMLESKRYAEAEDLYKRALEGRPDDPAVHANLGTLYYIQKKYPKAAESYSSTVRLDPSFKDANYYLARSYHEMKRFSDAKHYYKEAAALTPSDAQIYFQMGRLGEEMNDRGFAKESYLNALDRGYDGPEADINLGRMYFEEKLFDQAAKHLSNAVKADERNHLAHYNLAMAYKELQNTADAEKHFKNTARIDPDYYPAYYQLGNIYFNRNNLEDAEFNYKKAVILKPDYAEAHFNLGIVYLKMKSDDLAEEHLRKSCELGYSAACDAVSKRY